MSESEEKVEILHNIINKFTNGLSKDIENKVRTLVPEIEYKLLNIEPEGYPTDNGEMRYFEDFLCDIDAIISEFRRKLRKLLL